MLRGLLRPQLCSHQGTRLIRMRAVEAAKHWEKPNLQLQMGHPLLHGTSPVARTKTWRMQATQRTQLQSLFTSSQNAYQESCAVASLSHRQVATASANEKLSPQATVEFVVNSSEVDADTTNLLLVGDCGALGSWQASNGLVLQLRELHRWVAHVNLGAGSHSFKVVRVTKDKVEWEKGSNRTVQVSDDPAWEASAKMVVTCQLDDTTCTTIEIMQGGWLPPGSGHSQSQNEDVSRATSQAKNGNQFVQGKLEQANAYLASLAQKQQVLQERMQKLWRMTQEQGKLYDSLLARMPLDFRGGATPAVSGALPMTSSYHPAASPPPTLPSTPSIPYNPSSSTPHPRSSTSRFMQAAVPCSFSQQPARFNQSPGSVHGHREFSGQCQTGSVTGRSQVCVYSPGSATRQKEGSVNNPPPPPLSPPIPATGWPQHALSSRWQYSTARMHGCSGPPSSPATELEPVLFTFANNSREQKNRSNTKKKQRALAAAEVGQSIVHEEDAEFVPDKPALVVGKVARESVLESVQDGASFTAPAQQEALGAGMSYPAPVELPTVCFKIADEQADEPAEEQAAVVTRLVPSMFEQEQPDTNTNLDLLTAHPPISRAASVGEQRQHGLESAQEPQNSMVVQEVWRLDVQGVPNPDGQEVQNQEVHSSLLQHWSSNTQGVSLSKSRMQTEAVMDDFLASLDHQEGHDVPLTEMESITYSFFADGSFSITPSPAAAAEQVDRGVAADTSIPEARDKDCGLVPLLDGSPSSLALELNVQDGLVDNVGFMEYTTTVLQNLQAESQRSPWYLLPRGAAPDLLTYLPGPLEPSHTAVQVAESVLQPDTTLTLPQLPVPIPTLTPTSRASSSPSNVAPTRPGSYTLSDVTSGAVSSGATAVLAGLLLVNASGPNSFSLAAGQSPGGSLTAKSNVGRPLDAQEPGALLRLRQEELWEAAAGAAPEKHGRVTVQADEVVDDAVLVHEIKIPGQIALAQQYVHVVPGQIEAASTQVELVSDLAGTGSSEGETGLSQLANTSTRQAAVDVESSGFDSMVSIVLSTDAGSMSNMSWNRSIAETSQGQDEIVLNVKAVVPKEAEAALSADGSAFSQEAVRIEGTGTEGTGFDIMATSPLAVDAGSLFEATLCRSLFETVNRLDMQPATWSQSSVEAESSGSGVTAILMGSPMKQGLSEPPAGWIDGSRSVVATEESDTSLLYNDSGREVEDYIGTPESARGWIDGLPAVFALEESEYVLSADDGELVAADSLASLQPASGWTDGLPAAFALQDGDYVLCNDNGELVAVDKPSASGPAERCTNGLPAAFALDENNYIPAEEAETDFFPAKCDVEDKWTVAAQSTKYTVSFSIVPELMALEQGAVLRGTADTIPGLDLAFQAMLGGGSDPVARPVQLLSGMPAPAALAGTAVTPAATDAGNAVMPTGTIGSPFASGATIKKSRAPAVVEHGLCAPAALAGHASVSAIKAANFPSAAFPTGHSVATDSLSCTAGPAAAVNHRGVAPDRSLAVAATDDDLNLDSPACAAVGDTSSTPSAAAMHSQGPPVLLVPDVVYGANLVDGGDMMDSDLWGDTDLAAFPAAADTVFDLDRFSYMDASGEEEVVCFGDNAALKQRWDNEEELEAQAGALLSPSWPTVLDALDLQLGMLLKSNLEAGSVEEESAHLSARAPGMVHAAGAGGMGVASIDLGLCTEAQDAYEEEEPPAQPRQGLLNVSMSGADSPISLEPSLRSVLLQHLSNPASSSMIAAELSHVPSVFEHWLEQQPNARNWASVEATCALQVDVPQPKASGEEQDELMQEWRDAERLYLDRQAAARSSSEPGGVAAAAVMASSTDVAAAAPMAGSADMVAAVAVAGNVSNVDTDVSLAVGDMDVSELCESHIKQLEAVLESAACFAAYFQQRQVASGEASGGRNTPRLISHVSTGQ